MKKVIFCITSMAMASAMAVSAPAAAQGQSEFNKAVVEFCSAFGNDSTGPGLPTKGSCVSFYKVGGPVAFCKQLKDFEALEFFGFSTQGECVAALKN
ncbi:hypothetical protein KUW15_01650 [Qipengyuania aquimaris]|uniref:hypothetical protein n=1 Tax=Qipengyuania aquimaris TaxID=255984 RepID=UPI001C95407D|nr:hypothetical protein [Qipengyuania aquimaris]MBY6127412.1 hypothetical protein [Qipengyuania aquimaris]